MLGNERVDSLAKLGTSTAIDAPNSPYLSLRPLTSSRGEVCHAIMESWSEKLDCVPWWADDQGLPSTPQSYLVGLSLC